MGPLRRQLRQSHYPVWDWQSLASGGATIKRGPRGLFLGEGYRFGFPVAGAFTVGNVITTSSTWDTDAQPQSVC